MCLRYAGIVLKWLHESSWFWCRPTGFSRLLSRGVLRKVRYLQNKGTSVYNFFPKSGLTENLVHGTSTDAECDTQTAVVIRRSVVNSSWRRWTKPNAVNSRLTTQLSVYSAIVFWVSQRRADSSASAETCVQDRSTLESIPDRPWLPSASTGCIKLRGV